MGKQRCHKLKPLCHKHKNQTVSQNCQALVVRLNAWLWKPKATTTITATLERFATTKTPQASMQQPDEVQRRNLTTTIWPIDTKKGRTTGAKIQLIAAVPCNLG
ncbi:hypothetical protein J5N62_01190 [Vibrio sp. CC007]|nr:hypothetical protein [Vibrio sp. CC007]